VQPSIQSSREAVVDRLRGFALLGVVIVNAPFLLTSSEGITGAAMPTVLDRVAGAVVWVGFQAKAYLIFAFLFGYSFTIFLRSLQRRGLPVRRVYLQRLAALLVIGVGHALLLFPGDILVVYGLLGVLCLLLRHRPDRALRRWAIGAYVVQVLFFAGLLLVPGGTDAGPGLAGVDDALRGGNLLDTTMAHAQLWPGALAFILFVQGPLVVAAFAVGLLAGRGTLLSAPEQHRAFWQYWRVRGLLIGVPLQAISGLLALRPGSSDLDIYLALALQYLGAPVMSLGLVATLVLLPRRGLTRQVEAEGRLSLSVYLAESLILTTLAVGWGFGLLGLTAAPALAAAVTTWAALLIAAHLWQHHAGAGPAERLLRRLTFARTSAHQPRGVDLTLGTQLSGVDR
jgi:uncharacterized protein